jgi:uncharacterized protein
VLELENGKALLSSEMYVSKEALLEGMELIRKNAIIPEQYVRKTENAGKPYFELIAANQEPIGTSELFASREAMEKGIHSVKNNAPRAAVVDESGEKRKEEY